jgi:hypothetical protein
MNPSFTLRTAFGAVVVAAEPAAVMAAPGLDVVLAPEPGADASTAPLSSPPQALSNAAADGSAAAAPSRRRN